MTETANNNAAATQTPVTFDPLATTPATVPAANTLAPVFVKVKGDFLHGELKRESVEAVEKLHENFKARIKETVDAAFKGRAEDPKLYEAATAYCIANARTRKELTSKQLAQSLNKGAETLAVETTTLLADLVRLEEALARRLSKKKDDYDYYDDPEPDANHPFKGLLRGLQTLASKFGLASPPAAETPPFPAGTEQKTEGPQPVKVEADRIYYRLEDFSRSPVQPLVEDFLNEKGYTVTDYADGYAVDGRKNKCKIGKLLKDANPGLYEAFCEDSTRMAKNLLVVITKDYGDLARASYGRGWQSCRAEAGSAVRYAVKEVKIGVMSAYLIREGDPDINDPLGRVNIKPYDSGSGPLKKTAYFTFNPIGLHHPGFVNAVNRFVEEHLNGDKFGTFRLRDGCENYREFDTRTRLPVDAEAAFKQLGIRYTREEDGKIHVKGDLSLAGLGLSRLPDMRDVVVEGGIDVSNNKLMTLEGLPTAPIKFLNAQSNLLGCFTGAPEDVGRKFNYKDNCYLVTTYGAPKAEVYEFGNGYEDQRRYGTSDKCVGPVEQPDRFPSFKRKR